MGTNLEKGYNIPKRPKPKQTSTLNSVKDGCNVPIKKPKTQKKTAHNNK